LPVDQIVIWNRTDAGLRVRLRGFRLSLLDGERRAVWEKQVSEAPDPSATFPLTGVRDIAIATVHADYSQPGFEAEGVLGKKGSQGWAVGGQTGKPHALTLIAAAPIEAAAGSRLGLTIEQLSKHEQHTLGRLRVSSSADPRAAELAGLPERILALVRAAHRPLG